MSQKLECLLELAQSNVMGSMMDTLADELGVKIEALNRLGIGWLPMVEFKSGKKSFEGWWAIPEYDARGNLIGISLRGREGKKRFYNKIEGNRGLVFSINENRTHKFTYKPGAHNWVRTHESGIECPMCGKPDGCLLSKDDPEDPSAVICRVVEEGSKKETKLGWLHILKEDTAPRSKALIADSEHPIVIVEGMSDAAAAISLGLEAVGRPSDRGGLVALAKMVRGRDVVVVGENDQKADGRAPGFEGMKAAATALQEHCPNVLKVMPPPEYKDLRTWYRDANLTLDEFMEHVNTRGDASVENPILKDDNPTTAARSFLKDCFTHESGQQTIVRWMKSGYHVFNDGKYTLVDEEGIETRLRKWSFGRSYLTQKPNSPDPILVPIRQTKGWVSNVMAAIPSETRPGMFNDQISPPQWLPGFSGQDPRLLIPFRNGVLDVMRWCQGRDNYLLPHTPQLFNLHCLPYDFDPDAVSPDWTPFLRSSLRDEAAKIRLIQEWYGYCMTGLTNQQKFLVLVGAKNSGKSVILHTLEHLVGSENYGAGDPKQLTERFGFAGQVGKLVTGFDELTLTRDVDNIKLGNIFKQLSGEASVAVEEKGKDSRRASLNCRMMMTCNTMPYMRDTEDALYRRLMVVSFNHSAQVRDTTLRDKFKEQIPGIALWALKGLRRLIRQGEFTVPKSMQTELDMWSDATNPIKSFKNSCCHIGSSQFVDESLIYGMFLQYMKARHRDHKPTSCLRFVETLCRNSDGQITLMLRQEPGKKQPVRTLVGVGLQDWVEDEFILDGD